MDMDIGNYSSSLNSLPDYKLDKKRSKRRSKNEMQGRHFKCGCGKMYLSYPALYTHVKTKHDGTQPEGTDTPAFKQGRGRGRPRKNPIQPDTSIMLDNSDDSFLTDRGFFSGSSDPLKGFEDEEKKSSSILYHKIREWIVKENEPIDPFSLVCEDILALYLIDAAKANKQEFYKTFVLLIENMRRCLNTIGWNVPGENKKHTGDYCSIKGAQHIPEICNEFITDYLPQHCSTLDKSIATHITMHLCKWLYLHGYSLLKLVLID